MGGPLSGCLVWARTPDDRAPACDTSGKETGGEGGGGRVEREERERGVDKVTKVTDREKVKGCESDRSAGEEIDVDF